MQGYVLTNGQFYVTQPSAQRYSYDTDPHNAAIFPTEKKAANVLSRTLPKNFKSHGYRPRLVDFPDNAVPDSGPIKMIRLHIEQDPLEQRNMGQAAAVLQEISAGPLSVSRMGELMRLCRMGVEEEDRVQEDLLHRIEYESGAKGNAARLCAQMKACRMRRRAYKDAENTLKRMFTAPGAPIDPDRPRLYRPRSLAVFTQQN